jgi:hypothetical protein
VLDLLGRRSEFDVPELVAAGPNPACLVTRMVQAGVPLSYELVRDATADKLDRIAGELAGFLAKLHSAEFLALAREWLGEPLRVPEPGLQATTDELRSRFTAMIEPSKRARVQHLCDWVDEQLATAGKLVFVHGDFHAYNQLWDPSQLRLALVADFETSGVAEPEYDFRAIPSFGPGVGLLTATVEHYAALTDVPLGVPRIMALHTCTTLGDALWRSEAGLPLLLPRPGGGTPDDYVDELTERLAGLGIDV